MNRTKIFIDGSEGTTGLRIFERFEGREDIELLKIPSALRKEPEEIRKYICASDITFLCLPDAAAREAAELVKDEEVILIDTSTAHRTEEGWAYGFPELSTAHREKIKGSRRIAVPGCYATGFITLAYPLVKEGILPDDYPVSVFAVSGYSGGGKKLIAEYEEEQRDMKYGSARMYAFGQNHKHLKEMQIITGLKRAPLFSPLTTDYYSGMVVELPLYADLLDRKMDPEGMRNFFAAYYQDEPFIRVMPYGAEAESGILFSNGCAGYDGIEIYVTGNAERMLAVTRFDNLGKGASGAAVQCMNLVMGCREDKGLNL